jgi:4-hydroxybenzoate polyprenyltransferase
MTLSLSQAWPCALFALVCLALTVAVFVQDRRQGAALLRNLRWERALHYVGMLALGVYMSGTNHFNPWVLLTASLVICLAWGSAVASNDVVDREIDCISNPDRPLVKGIWSPRAFGWLALVQGMLAITGGFCINLHFVAAIAIYLLIAVVYSIPPLRLKRYLGLSTGLIACASLVMVVAGFVCTGERTWAQFPKPVAAFFLLTLTCGVNFKDIKDFEGDRRDGIWTLVTWLGLRRGKMATAILAAISFLSAPWIFDRPSLWPVSCIFAGMAMVLVTRAIFREKLFFLLYYGYFVILLMAGLFRAPTTY